MESAACLRYGIKTEGEGRYTASRDAIRLMGDAIQRAARVDSIPSPSVLDKLKDEPQAVSQ